MSKLAGVAVCRSTLVTTAALTAFLLSWFLALAPHANASPFTNSVIYTWREGGDSPLDGIVQSQGTSGASFSSPSRSGEARAAQGDIGAFARATQSGIDGISAQAAWSDGFTVQGPLDAATVRLSIRLHGMTAGSDPHWGWVHGLWMKSSAFTPPQGLFDALEVNSDVQGATLLLFDQHDDVSGQLPAGPYDQTFTVSFSAQTGVPFYLLSVLDVMALGTATTDFLQSAIFGVTVDGGTLVTLSGTQYPAAAVPAPATLALVAIALAIFGAGQQRRSGPTRLDS